MTVAGDGWHLETACWPAGPATVTGWARGQPFTSLLLRKLLDLLDLGKSPFPLSFAGEKPRALPSCAQWLLRFLPLIGYPKFKIPFQIPPPMSSVKSALAKTAGKTQKPSPFYF